MSEQIHIFDTTLRDGEQVPGCQLNTVEKVAIARQLELLGVDIIEAGFPISSPGDFRSVVEISKAVSEPVICALTRAVQKDIDVAAESLQYAKRKRIHTGIGVSDYHNKYKFNATQEQIIERAVAAVKYARLLDAPLPAASAIAAGATVVNFPDTTGYCRPEVYGAKIRYLTEHVANIDRAIISCHCHNDLGMATANTIAGIQNGARQVEVTMNGIGERAGNTALEEVAMILKTHQQPYHTRIDSQKIYMRSMMVSKMMHMPVQPNKAIVGRNAFAHSSGIHQDGVLKNRENYEIIAPQDVGIPESSIILTARSGKAALRHHLQRLDYQVDDRELKAVYERFLVMADGKKMIGDEDLIELMEGIQRDKPIEIQHVQVVCGQPIHAVATVELSYRGEAIRESATGNGPVNAIIRAIDRIVGVPVELEEFLVHSMAKGSEDEGKVHVKIKHAGRSYSGFGIDEDVVMGSVKAYVNALNKVGEVQRARVVVATA